LDIVKLLKNKKQRKMFEEIKMIESEYTNIHNEAIYYKRQKIFNKQLVELEEQKQSNSNYLIETVNITMDILKQKGFVEFNNNNDIINNNCNITTLGVISSQIHEVHGLVFADAFINNHIFNKINILDDSNNLHENAINIIAIFSCFTSIKVKDALKTSILEHKDENVRESIKNILNNYQMYYDIETKYRINSGINYDITYDLMPFVIDWCYCENDNDCKQVFQDLYYKKEISSGEFIKVLLKINCISLEFEPIAKYLNNIDLLEQLRSIPKITLKYLATTQSLYIN
jgi:hypothetical protein